MRFLKLSKTVINISHLSLVEIGKNKFTIHMNQTKQYGFHFWGSGFVETSTVKRVIDEMDNPEDYAVVKNFIENVPKG